MSEYKEEPVLTAREKHFVECIEDGYVARDENGELYFHKEKPRKTGDGWWSGDILCGLKTFGDIFHFITWEDEGPWSIEALRKLKVQE